MRLGDCDCAKIKLRYCAGCEATHLELLAWEDAVGDLHLIERLIHRLASWSRCRESGKEEPQERAVCGDDLEAHFA